MNSKQTEESIRKRLEYIKNEPIDDPNEYTKFITLQLRHQNPEIRLLAIECLWDYPWDEGAEVLISLAQDDPEESVRNKAIIGLGRYIYEGDVEMDEDDKFFLGDYYYDPIMTVEQCQKIRDFLIALYTNPEKSLDERRFALESLAFLSQDDVKQFIRDAYASDEKGMKISAIFAMGRQQTNWWHDPILEALTSDDADIRNEAIKSAGECQIDDAHDFLMYIARTTEDKDECVNAVMALSSLGMDESFEFLDELRYRVKVELDNEFTEYIMEEWIFSNQIRHDDIFDDWL